MSQLNKGGFGRINTGRFIDRRSVLRGTGVAMALPYLTSMRPAHAGAQKDPPKRFVAFTLGLGLLPENLFPKDAGADYAATPYLKPLQDIRDDFTVMSGVSHVGVTGGHRAEASILTGTAMGASGGTGNTVSLDQLLAKHLGDDTRFPSLTLSASGNTSPCYTESGAMIPPIDRPAALFDMLFTTGTPAERRGQAAAVARGRSIMDLVGEDARALQRELGGVDRQRLDAYFTSVRELEKRLRISEGWAMKPKPAVDVEPIQNVRNRADFVAQFATMAEVMKLAMQTDSTRFLTLHLGGGNHKLPREGVQDGYHTLSHHGKDEDKLQQLTIVETALVSAWGGFVRSLGETEEGGHRLLDHSSVLLTSNLGNASNHNNKNMPLLFAGGPFKHAGHLAFDRNNNYPLCNLYLSIAQRSGLEIDAFSSRTGVIEQI